MENIRPVGRLRIRPPRGWRAAQIEIFLTKNTPTAAPMATLIRLVTYAGDDVTLFYV